MYNSANSEVYKMLQEAENEPPEPEEPRTFSPNPVCTAPNVVGPTKHVTAPINQQPVNRANTGGLPTGQNICAECERLIVGVFVRIKDKNLHVDCFKCATCGSSLKNQGYFNINGKLYCDVHAKLIAMKNPPPGTEGYVPVPIKPTSKLSANTISQALSAHHNISVNGNPGLITSSAPVSNLNANIGGPKPYSFGSAAPMSPPVAAPKSPSTYPPPSGAPAWTQPKTYASATLPRSSHASHNTPEPGLTQNYSIPNQTQTVVVAPAFEPGRATEMLEESVRKLRIGDKDKDDKFREEANRMLTTMLLKAQMKETEEPQKVETITRSSSPPLPPPPPPISVPPMDASMVNITSFPSPPPLETDFEPNYSTPNKNKTKLPDETQTQKLENSVVRRRNSTKQKSRSATDRRSYIEKPMTETLDESSLETEPKQIANNLVDGKHPVCCVCSVKITRGPFITALGRIWCPDHFVCVNGDCRRPLADIGFVEEKGDLYCEYCFERFIAPSCCKCNSKIKGDCLNAIGKHFHPECFTCAYCGKLFGNSPFFLEDGSPYCEADWNEMFTTKCFACGFPVEAGDRWVEALGNNYHSQCFNCTACKKNLEGQSFFAKSGRPFCKAHAR